MPKHKKPSHYEQERNRKKLGLPVMFPYAQTEHLYAALCHSNRKTLRISTRRERIHNRQMEERYESILAK